MPLNVEGQSGSTKLHAYILLCKDSDDIPMKLIKEKWAWGVTLIDGRIHEVMVLARRCNNRTHGDGKLTR